ncbi:MAG: hypothetical protein HQK49_19560, partial [Oligoflexia bacterium]|nr:hypothetical protein [Oligoflexia bacterium]
MKAISCDSYRINLHKINIFLIFLVSLIWPINLCSGSEVKGKPQLKFLNDAYQQYDQQKECASGKQKEKARVLSHRKSYGIEIMDQGKVNSCYAAASAYVLTKFLKESGSLKKEDELELLDILMKGNDSERILDYGNPANLLIRLQRQRADGSRPTISLTNKNSSSYTYKQFSQSRVNTLNSYYLNRDNSNVLCSNSSSTVSPIERVQQELIDNVKNILSKQEGSKIDLAKVESEEISKKLQSDDKREIVLPPFNVFTNPIPRFNKDDSFFKFFHNNKHGEVDIDKTIGLFNDQLKNETFITVNLFGKGGIPGEERDIGHYVTITGTKKVCCKSNNIFQPEVCQYLCKVLNSEGQSGNEKHGGWLKCKELLELSSNYTYISSCGKDNGKDNSKDKRKKTKNECKNYPQGDSSVQTMLTNADLKGLNDFIENEAKTKKQKIMFIEKQMKQNFNGMKYLFVNLIKNQAMSEFDYITSKSENLSSSTNNNHSEALKLIRKIFSEKIETNPGGAPAFFKNVVKDMLTNPQEYVAYRKNDISTADYWLADMNLYNVTSKLIKEYNLKVDEFKDIPILHAGCDVFTMIGDPSKVPLDHLPVLVRSPDNKIWSVKEEKGVRDIKEIKISSNKVNPLTGCNYYLMSGNP